MSDKKSLAREFFNKALEARQMQAGRGGLATELIVGTYIDSMYGQLASREESIEDIGLTRAQVEEVEGRSRAHHHLFLVRISNDSRCLERHVRALMRRIQRYGVSLEDVGSSSAELEGLAITVAKAEAIVRLNAAWDGCDDYDSYEYVVKADEALAKLGGLANVFGIDTEGAYAFFEAMGEASRKEFNEE